MRRRKCKYLACLFVSVFIYYFFGVHDYLNTKDFDETFSYPLDIDLKEVVDRILEGQKPGVTPINYYPYRFLTDSGKCSIDKLDLLIVVKSAMNHFGHRMAVRKTYGQENVVPGKNIRTLFFLGAEGKRTNLQNEIDREVAEYRDVIQMNFVDNYYNNTIKTMMSFRWLYEYCCISDFYLFTDDDMYISVRNLLDYVNNPSSTENALVERDRTSYMAKLDELEEYNKLRLKPKLAQIEKARMRDLSLQDLEKGSKIDISKLFKPGSSDRIPKQIGANRQLVEERDSALDRVGELKRDTHIYAGYVFRSAPLRLMSSKWRVSLEEYPWNRWPDYVTAGAYVLSNRSMKTMYVASLFVKHFRFDDIYLGIVAKKFGITPVHCPNFYYYKKKYSRHGYKDVIASHGYGNHEELLRVWFEQNGEGAVVSSP